MSEHAAQREQLLAAVDIGSNSFHMVIAQELQGDIRTLEKRGQKVQLGAGLGPDGYLSAEACQRGVECLREFAQRLQGMDPKRVSVLATNALRAARNRQQFIDQAEAVLGYPIEVISGREEARLIYLGVSHTLADDRGRRLVIDIGGGSTEFIIGERFEPLELESLHMGCVSFTRRFFADGQITAAAFDEAVAAARQELLNIESNYKRQGWNNVVGSSGTIRAAEQAIIAQGWASEGVSRQNLKKLRKLMLNFATTDDVDLPGIKPERRQVFIGGLAILQAAFDTLDIQHLQYSDGALREGALWDLVGRSSHENVRERVVNSLAERFHVDLSQAQRVAHTATALLRQAAPDWLMSEQAWQSWLNWGAHLHEIGLSLTHSGFHKHGAYLLQHSDLLGFTRQGQAALAMLVRSHRRKFRIEEFDGISQQWRRQFVRLAMLLRLAVLLNHSRGAHEVPEPSLQVTEQGLRLTFPSGWLSEHPLTARDLASERDYWAAAGLELLISDGTEE
ncbi:exopolyphosphatase [Bacterioplanes sanyensis]|uniref:exopolyphosphatase n=1 Tax=Bacterioplanes sanyensis TaxID=1249553 RepID=UPI001677E6C2|nr:exopolyphosphatase [Bacterioplanes sanyensis]GGY53468.1 exopolyphosphatase [Bacterioplanes sanyensis]